MACFSLFPTPIGDCAIAWRGDEIVATNLPEKTPAATAARLAARAGASEGAPPPTVRHAIASITALLQGEHPDLRSIRCDFSGIDPFAAEVYTATPAIPVGETQTYGSIALQLGDKLLAQDVGRALGRNPFPLIVPCHRVVGANHKRTGFSAYGGIDTKRRILAIEGARVEAQQGQLFGDLPQETRMRE